MPTADPHKLPVPLGPIARLGPRRPWLGIGQRLAARLLKEGVLYEDAQGFPLRIDPSDPFQRLMIMGWFDPIVEALFEPHVPKDGVVVDAGANIGYFTLRLARAVGSGGQVHAFEADPRVAPRLRDHVERAGFDWVIVNEVALHESSGGELTFRLTDQWGWGGVEDVVWEASGTATVPSVALDDYLEERAVAPESLSFLKIDVEGAEMPVLTGMARTLERATAPVLVEVIPWRLENQGRSVEGLVEFMSAHGYDPWSPISFDGTRVELAPGTSPAIGEDVLFKKRPLLGA
jgi:FkbM family methyltransferase